MSQNLCLCNVCQSEIWPWSSEPGTVEDENGLQHNEIYPWTANIPFDDPLRFEKYIQDLKSPEKQVEQLSKALHNQIERTKSIDNTCKQMMSDKVMSKKVLDVMRDRILELEKENDFLCKLLQNKNPQHLKITNPQTSTKTNQRTKEQALYRECMKETRR